MVAVLKKQVVGSPMGHIHKTDAAGHARGKSLSIRGKCYCVVVVPIRFREQWCSDFLPIAHAPPTKAITAFGDEQSAIGRKCHGLEINEVVEARERADSLP